MLLSEIVDHRTDGSEVKNEDGFIETRGGGKRRLRTTKGWELCVCWKDGSTTWVKLKELKNSFPIELAQYAVSNKIASMPAFAWWVPFVLKKKDRIISKLKSKYWSRTHKYGIKIPKTVEEAYAIDEENGNDFWRRAIVEEMSKVRVAFELYEDDPSKLIGYQQIKMHMVFDVKLGENFRRKARLVADGHLTNPPSSVTYSSVVSRDSVRLCLLAAALNNLDVMCADIENAYLSAPPRENCWTIAGKEFGNEEGKAFIIVRALYGLKSSGAAFRSHLAQCLDEVGFRPSIADADVWMRMNVKCDGEEYYEFILVYVDDLMAISHEAKECLGSLKQFIKFKKDRIEEPSMYLGATLEKKYINGHKCWTISSKDYIKNVLKHIEKIIFEERKMKFYTRALTPMQQGFIPELDASGELDANNITLYQE